MRAFGSDPIAYSTLQPGMQYLDTSFGYIAYRKVWGRALALGPPICDLSDRSKLIGRFLKAHRSAAFLYVQKDVAWEVERQGDGRLHLCGMGTDRVLPLQQTSSPPHARVTGALKKAAKAGLFLDEISIARLTEPERAELDAVTRAYLAQSSVSVEMRFLNRPAVWREDGLSRTFLIRSAPEKKVLGYAVLDPSFAAGRPRGYLLNLFRLRPTRVWGVYYAVVSLLASQLRQEGLEALSLGFCPLVDVDTQGAPVLLGAQMRGMERTLGGIEYLSRLKEMKEAFPTQTVPRYFVAPSVFVLPTLIRFLRACGVPLGGILRRSVQ